MTARLLPLLLLFALASPAVQGHGRHSEGTLLVCDGADSGVLALVESVAPGALPTGVCFAFVPDVGGGFELSAVDPQHALVVGLGDSCPGEAWSVTDPATYPDAWILCTVVPDFDVRFTGGAHPNGPGDESGTTPGAGGAHIVLFLGDETSPLGPESFVFHDRL